MRRMAVGFVVLAALVSGGCFTLSNTIKEEVTPPGRVQFGLGALTSDDGAMPMADIRWGMAQYWDIGTRMDSFSLSLDTRFQLLTEENNNVNSTLELGLGVAFISVFEYVGIGFGKDFGRVNPYLHVRYMHAVVDRAEMSGESGSFIEDLYLRFSEDAIDVVQVFVGLDLEISDKCSITPEIVWVPGLDDLMFINVALNFRFW